MSDSGRVETQTNPEAGSGRDVPRAWVRVCLDWLLGVRTRASVSSPPTVAHDAAPARVGHFVIARKIGEGGMGVVYAAHDDRLDRSVALKMISPRNYDDTTRARFWREARAAAAVNHPHICQIYEIGESDGDLFIAMELLDGEPLDARLRQGPMDVSHVVQIGHEALAALSALHASGIVHRDLKPSNVFLSPHGVKLLDFGLAQPRVDGADGERGTLTRTGLVLGTPHYLAPERIAGGLADDRSDLFAVGAILFEMLSGRRAFGGNTVPEVLHAVAYEQPPALEGSAAVRALDRLIRRALAKRPDDRPASAAEMSAELKRIQAVGADKPAAVHVLTRVLALPFKVLRADSDSDFLAFSLPDAVTASLSANGSLTVRSSAVAARFSNSTPDLQTIATEADVDRVITGTLLRSGGELRVSVQLVEVPGGTLLAAHTTQSSMHDLFRLQDDLVRRILPALSVPLFDTVPRGFDAPRDPRAYELYLRAKDLARSHDSIVRARSLYDRCLELDPGYAPAWAHLGRCHWVISKFIDGASSGAFRAESALRHALDLNPQLTVAHKYLANLEADSGHSIRALARLVEQVKHHGNDAELFAGLVHACRYCGLNDVSLAAHAEARRLDPNVPTSVAETLLIAGDIEHLLDLAPSVVPTGAEDANRVIGLGLAGRRDEARLHLQEMRRVFNTGVFEAWTRYLSAWLDRRPDEMVIDSSAFGPLAAHEDPEAIFQDGWLLCDAGGYERGLSRLEQAVAKGYFAIDTLSSSMQFDAIRQADAFQSLLAGASSGRQEALSVFREGGGPLVLGTWDLAA